MSKINNFAFSCPHCGQHLSAEPDMAGMELECPGCGKTITVPQPATGDVDESSKQYGTEIAKSERFKKVCTAVKSGFFFCGASVWFVLRGIGIGIGKALSFIVGKAFKRPLPLKGLSTRVNWIWQRTIMPIGMRWRKYEGRRLECAEGTSAFAAMSMGRRLACGATGCALLAILVSQLSSSGDSESHSFSSYSSSGSSSSSFSSDDSGDTKTPRLKSGAEKVLLSKYAYDPEEVRRP